MKKIIMAFAVLALVFGFDLSTARAAGVGLFASMGSGSPDWTSDFTPFSFSTDMDHETFGLVFDTNLATQRLFNYRLEIGRTELTAKNFAGTGTDFDLDGFTMSHDFGFGAPLGQAVRFWLGPELRFTWVDGSLRGDPLYDMDLFGFGVGAAAGLNINLPANITLAVKAAYVMMNYTGDGHYRDTFGNYLWTDYDADEDLKYVTVALIIRAPWDNASAGGERRRRY